MLYNELPASKTILAKLMARENVSVIQRNLSTAMFDPVSRTVYIPYWKEMTADMYDVQISHETGHALDTPVDKENFKGVLATYINIIEDGRIEKRQIRRLPGLQKSYRIGRREMFNRGFYKTTQEQVASRTFIDRINLYFKCHIWGILNVQFKKGFESNMMKKIILTDTYAEVVQYAKEVLAYDKRQAKKKKQEFSLPMNEGKKISLVPPAENEEEEEVLEQPEIESGDGQEEPEETEISSEAEEESKEKLEQLINALKNMEETSSEEEKEEQEGGVAGSGDSEEEMTDEEFEEETDIAPSEEAFEENMKNLVDGNAEHPSIMVSLPKMNAAEYIIGPSEVHKICMNYALKSTDSGILNSELAVNYNKFRTENSAAINSLAKEFEIRKAGDRHHRMRNTRLGDLDMNKIHEYKFNDKLFLGGSVSDDGKNHGVVMLIDMSGSMTKCMVGVVKQYLIMAEFCKRVNIPFDIYGFSNHGPAIEKKKASQYQPRENDAVIDFHFRLINLLSSSQPAAEYKKQFALLANYGNGYKSYRNNDFSEEDGYGLTRVDMRYCELLTLYGTPLVGAMYLMPNLIKSFKTKHAVQIVNLIVLTDGDGDHIEHYKVNHKDFVIFNSRRTKVTFVDRESAQTYEYEIGPEQTRNINVRPQDCAYFITMNLLSKRVSALNCRVVNINLCDTYGHGANYKEMFTKSDRAEKFFGNQKIDFYKKRADEKTEPFLSFNKKMKEIGFTKVDSKLYTYEIFLATNTLQSTLIEVDEKSSAKKIASSIMENSKNKNKDRMLAIEVSKLISD